jgi:hypothetical protein
MTQISLTTCKTNVAIYIQTLGNIEKANLLNSSEVVATTNLIIRVTHTYASIYLI